MNESQWFELGTHYSYYKNCPLSPTDVQDDSPISVCLYIEKIKRSLLFMLIDFYYQVNMNKRIRKKIFNIFLVNKFVDSL